MTTTPESIEAATAQALALHANEEGALLPVLHAIQTALGHVPEEGYGQIARALGITVAEVHGVVSFYHDFKDTAPKGAVVKLCASEACQAMGADAVKRDIDTAQGVTVEPVYCLGLCALAPAALVGDRPLARATADRIHDALAEARA